MYVIRSILVHLNLASIPPLELEISRKYGWQVDDVFEGEAGTDKILLFTFFTETSTYDHFVSWLRGKKTNGEIRAIAHPLPAEGLWWVTVLPSNGHLLQIVPLSAFEEPEIIDLTVLEEFRQEEMKWDRATLIAHYKALQQHEGEPLYASIVHHLSKAPPQSLDGLRSWTRDRLARSSSMNERQVLDRFLLDLDQVDE